MAFRSTKPPVSISNEALVALPAGSEATFAHTGSAIRPNTASPRWPFTACDAFTTREVTHSRTQFSYPIEAPSARYRLMLPASLWL